MINIKRAANSIKRGWSKLKRAVSPNKIEKYTQKEAFDFLPTPSMNITQDVSLQMASLRPSNVGAAPTLIRGGSLEIASLTPSNVGDAPSFVLGGVENTKTQLVNDLKTKVVESIKANEPLTRLESGIQSNVPAKVEKFKTPFTETPKTDVVLDGVRQQGMPYKPPAQKELLLGEGIHTTPSADTTPSVDLSKMHFGINLDTNAPLIPAYGSGTVLTGAESKLNFARGSAVSEAIRKSHADFVKQEQTAVDALTEVRKQKEKFVPEAGRPKKSNTMLSTHAALAVGALSGVGLTYALTRNRGQQSNAQLYGQQPLY